MHAAEASTPEPTYGDVEQLEQPLDRAVLAERPVQDREDGVGVEQPAARAQRRARSPSWRHVPSRASSTPQHLVPGRAQARRAPTRRSRARRRARRSARRRARRPSSASPPASCRRRRRVVGSGRGGVKLPTPIVTVAARLRPCRRRRSCCCTIPSSSCVGHVDAGARDLEAGACQRVDRLVLVLRRRRSGTSTSAGALATTSATRRALVGLRAAGRVLRRGRSPASAAASSFSVDRDREARAVERRCGRVALRRRRRPAPRPAAGPLETKSVTVVPRVDRRARRRAVVAIDVALAARCRTLVLARRP